jgi:hypothetical protein
MKYTWEKACEYQGQRVLAIISTVKFGKKLAVIDDFNNDNIYEGKTYGNGVIINFRPFDLTLMRRVKRRFPHLK